MAMIAAEVFSAFKAAEVEDELAKRAAAEVGDLHELIRTIDRRFAAVDERLARIETAVTCLRGTLGVTATGSLATAAGVFALVYQAVTV